MRRTPPPSSRRWPPRHRTASTVIDQHRDYGVFAVQGPRSADVLAGAGLPTDIDYMGFATRTARASPVRVCRSGYTGERGYEVLPRWDDAETGVPRARRARSAPRVAQVAGLGARDTLRTEMGYPLHGHELSVDISPVQARCGWAVGWKKPQFWGREALVAEKEAGPARRLWGLQALDRGVLRQGLTVSRDGGARSGRPRRERSRRRSRSASRSRCSTPPPGIAGRRRGHGRRAGPGVCGARSCTRRSCEDHTK